jgi:hypothetical protein
LHLPSKYDGTIRVLVTQGREVGKPRPTHVFNNAVTVGPSKSGLGIRAGRAAAADVAEYRCANHSTGSGETEARGEQP